MNKKNFDRWFTIALCGVMVVELLANLFIQTSIHGSIPKYYHVMVLFHIGTCLLAALYMAKGASDGDAKYFTGFSISLMLLQLMAVEAVASASNVRTHAITMEAIALICASALALGGNLGKKKAMILCIVLLVANTFFFIARVFVRHVFDLTIVSSLGSMVILSLINLCMNYAKYMNK